MRLAFRHMGGLSKDPEKRARQEAALRMSNPSAFTRSGAARQEPAEPDGRQLEDALGSIGVSSAFPHWTHEP
jgi:hypothetical protein